MSATMSAMAEIDKEVCADALKFVNLFNDSADRRREMVHVFYTPNDPSLIWNGNPYHGIEQIRNHWSQLPNTHHE